MIVGPMGVKKYNFPFDVLKPLVEIESIKINICFSALSMIVGLLISVI